jgi:pilus assembly protein CpaB
MLTRVILGLLIFLGLGGFGTVVLLALNSAPREVHSDTGTKVAEPMVAVLVANHSIHAGQLLRPMDLSVQPLPPGALPRGSIEDRGNARSSLAGALLRVSLPAGTLLLKQDLVEPGDHSYLAAVLLPGERAISIGVDAISGIAGLVWPGDHVELILTQSFDDPTMPTGHRLAAVTVIRGLRVIATDQFLVRGEQPSSGMSGERTITLEASPEQAERISVASRLGRLSLSVCSTETCGDPKSPPSLTWGSDVSPALAQKTDLSTVIHIFEGTSEPKELHFR